MVLGGLALNAGCTLGLEQLKVFKSPIPKLRGDTIHTFDEKGNKTVTE
jgi:hypothetical protein